MNNQPRPELQDKVPIDNNTIMTYEDCLKDLNATSAVVYEELNQQPPVANSQPQQPQQQQPTVSPNHPPPSHNDIQIMEQQQPPPQQQQQFQSQMNQHGYQNQNQPTYYDENRYFPQQHNIRPNIPKEQELSSFLDKNNINDIALIVLAYVIINNKVVTNLITKQFPSLFVDESPTTFGIVFQGFLLIFIWILSKKIISQYVNKM
jgi:hypothetical protein